MSIADRSILACWGVKGGKAGRPFQVTIDPGGPDERDVDALADAETGARPGGDPDPHHRRRRLGRPAGPARRRGGPRRAVGQGVRSRRAAPTTGWCSPARHDGPVADEEATRGLREQMRAEPPGGTAVLRPRTRLRHARGRAGRGAGGLAVTVRRMPVPEPIEVRKVPLHSVSDASELAKLIDDGVLEADRVIAVIGKTEGNGGVNDYTRIIADRAFREVLVAKGTRGADEVRQVPDRLVRRHRRRASARTRRSSRPCPADQARGDRRAAADGRLRDERAAAARGHRPHRDDHEGGRRGARRRWSGPASPTRRTCTTCRPRRRC